MCLSRSSIEGEGETETGIASSRGGKVSSDYKSLRVEEWSSVSVLPILLYVSNGPSVLSKSVHDICDKFLSK